MTNSISAFTINRASMVSQKIILKPQSGIEKLPNRVTLGHNFISVFIYVM